MRFFRTFISASEVIIPFEGEESKKRFEVRAKEFFDNMPPDAKRTFELLLLLIEFSTLFPYFKPFSSLSYEKREKVIRKWYHSKIMRKRNIISAIKGLCSMIYMSIPENIPEKLKIGDELCSVE
ncbi:hypothetical protein HRbin19_01208 [bacterium HR19]|nr:hypothetical protein HRbin19_01208 [bacterium HR19]